jgi:hypothetical protein
MGKGLDHRRVPSVYQGYVFRFVYPERKVVIVSHEEAPGHSATELFSPAEVEAMHADDRHAARNVVLLMCAVFTTGLVLYSIVAIAVDLQWGWK